MKPASGPHELSVVMGYSPVAVALALLVPEAVALELLEFALAVADADALPSQDSVMVMVDSTVVVLVPLVSLMLWLQAAATRHASSGRWEESDNILAE